MLSRNWPETPTVPLHRINSRALFLAFLLTAVVGLSLLLFRGGMTLLLEFVAAATGIWILALPSRGLVLYVFLIPLEVYLSEKLHVTSNQVIQVVLIATGIVFIIFQGTKKADPLGAWPRLRWLVVGLMAFMTLSLLWSIDLESSWHSLGRNLLAIGVFWVVIGAVHRQTQLETVTTAICLGATIVGLYALMQYWTHDLGALYPFFSPYYQDVWVVRGGGFSALGTFPNPNVLAGFGAMVFPLFLPKIAHSKAVMRALWVMAALVVSAATLLTFSKNGWIAILLVITAWPAIRSRSHRRGLFVPLLLAVVAFATAFSLELVDWFSYLFPNVEMATTAPRLRLWSIALSAFGQQPFLGYGLDGFATATLSLRADVFTKDLLRAHDLYLQTLVDQGIVGFALFFGTLAYVLAVGLRTYRRVSPNSARSTLLGLLMSTGAFLTFGLFDCLTGANAVVSMQWVVLGLLAAAVTIQNTRQAQAPSRETGRRVLNGRSSGKARST